MAAFQPPPYPIRAGGTAAPAFVGRTAETSAAEDAWAAVRAGARQLIFIGGEPGAGKSRLAAEIAAATHRAGAVVLLGTCSPESHGPYQPFVECLEHLLGGTETGALASCLPDSAAELLRLTPLVWRHQPGLPAPDGNDRDYRRELFDALTGLLHAVGEQRTVVCVLEDLHWAGQPTLQLLDHVVQHSAASRLLLLCTHRSTAPDRNDDLTYAIADLYRLDGVRRLDLAGLSAEEVAQYLVAEGGLSVRRAREYAAVLRDQTGGNPFFLRELWRDMTRPGGGAGLAPVRALGARAPVSVRDTLQRRLSRLTAGEHGVVETAAVLGDGGDVRVLVQACQATPAEVLGALDTAAQFGFVDAGELAHGRVLFPHTLTRQAVLDLTSPSRRAALHACVGEVLQASGADSPRMVRRLAYHFARAGALGYAGYGGKAAEYLTQAAREAERSLAFEDAAAWYAQAADLLDGTEAAREELWFSAAHSFLRAGDFAAARELYRKLCDSRDSQVRLRAAIGYEDAGWRPGLPGEDAVALLTRALDDVPADPGDPRYVWARASLGRAIAFTGDTGQARDLTWQALAQARELDEEQLLVHALEAMMWQAPGPESVDQYRELAAELARRAMASQNWDALGTAGVFQAGIAYIRADRAGWAEALAVLDRSVRGSGQPFLAYMRGCDDYAFAFLRGDFAAAAQVAEDLVELGRSFGPDDTEGPYGLQMYMVRRETGELEQVRPTVDVIRRSGDGWAPGLLALYTELGMTSEATALLAELLDWADEMPGGQSPWAQWTAVLVFLAETAIALRDTAAARRLRPKLTPYAGQQLIAGTFVAVFGPADTYLAALDSLLGDAESAGLLFRRAVAQAREFGAPVHEAAALTAWAVHLSAGDASRPRDAARSGGWADSGGPGSGLAAQVREQARRLAASTGQVRLQRRLRALDAAAPADGPDAAGLTPRELAVLRLLAEGSSNREIASQLKIAENTAANHVRSILLKTGAANRTQAAAMALSRRWLDDAVSRSRVSG
jgi:DNA-binding CsgD family transcriptional regulator/tetratricopeptide (TPR) repeat protein